MQMIVFLHEQHVDDAKYNQCADKIEIEIEQEQILLEESVKKLFKGQNIISVEIPMIRIRVISIALLNQFFLGSAIAQ